MKNSTVQPVTTKTVLGVPTMPPAFASEIATRARGLISRLDRIIAPPPVQILEAALSHLDHRVLVALCEAGVPDALLSKMRGADLAATLGVDGDRLDRLLRLGAAKGWVRIDRKGRVSPNRVTEFLRSDHPGGWRSWVDFVGGDEVTNAVGVLSCVGSNDGFAAINGQPFFDWMASHPDRWSTFDAAMAAGARMHGLTLDSALDWGEARHVCDIGGGTGELARVLLDRHPNWQAAVFDLPAVIERAVEHPRLKALAGDAFVHVPAGYDIYLLVNVLHDWDDARCVEILTNIAAATSPDSRIIVVDNNRRPVPRDDLALRADILMAALTNGGQERSAEEFAELGRRAGLEPVSATPLVSGDYAHELRPRTDPRTAPR